ncbi:uncharacterized protein LOC117108346 [Anneissia japonica]|uniref:uncharacterized protein LOC117108346 n=1 Tax=Anneissia japonica TaxID=1529436 RepID=UPI0014256A02|nr:uncharacterized protein LOC117108346 [Anneissia japonica]
MKTSMMEYAFIFLAICLQSGTGFKCLKCNEILKQNSDCKLLPSNASEVVECTTFCYTKIHKAAGLEVDMDRGCTHDEDCVEEDSCASITETGVCSSCCREDYCNHGYPKGSVTSNTVVWNGNVLCIIMSIVIAKMTDRYPPPQV